MKSRIETAAAQIRKAAQNLNNGEMTKLEKMLVSLAAFVEHGDAYADQLCGLLRETANDIEGK